MRGWISGFSRWRHLTLAASLGVAVAIAPVVASFASEPTIEASTGSYGYGSQAGAGDRIEVDVFARGALLAKRMVHTRVGVFARSSVSAGQTSFSVKLDSKARRALKRHHRLALTVKVTLAPLYGDALTITRSVVEHG